jgi:ribosomal protein S18 acetylase RimI-like enzyme
VLVYRQAYRYPFYHFSHAYLSNYLEHVQALLQMNGYQVCGGELFLDWANMNPQRPEAITDLKVEVELQKTSGLGRLPDIRVAAHYDGHEVGECICLSAAAFSKRDVVEDWIFTQWLGVTEAFQGLGLGRYLLGYALVEAQQSGYRHAAISTAVRNARALLFYANYGYQAVDWTRQFSRNLTE